MSADEVLGDGSVLPDRSGGARHAAPKKPLFTRLHVPAGKAIAMAAMPTAVLMGMGFTPTLAVADDAPTSNSQLADDYKDCLTALEGASASPSASPSPSASASDDDSKSDAEDSKDSKGDASDSGSEKSDGAKNPSSSKGSKDSSSGGSSSSGSGADKDPEPAPAPSASASAQEPSAGGTETESPAPAETEKTDKNVLETIGDAVKDVFDGGGIGGSAKKDDASPSPSASPSAADSGAKSGASGTSAGTGKSSGTAAEDTSDAVTDTAKDTTQKAGDKAGETAEDTGEKTDEAASDAKDAADASSSPSPSASASASPSPSASSTVKPEDCAAATDEESGLDNKILLPDDPWYLSASALLLKSADYQGIVEVKTANGTKKKVLKYVISGGTEIDDLHQTVDDKQKGVTYHVQAGAGTKSKITGGDTIMYTESISGNLFGLLPVTFSPQNPPPLNIPLIYFTKVKVVQAGQFGGNLHIPGMQVYTSKLAG
ncbi:hypothetical protein ABZ330_30360 [Streptomyces sp. NPDC006172]|uniref:hypothetical protein n=1 Tax=Streptomyces sp. NPDC006172 TaxID=3154470 RepID=UPI0033D731E4